MAQFTYSALDAKNNYSRGNLTISNLRQAREQLEKQGLTIITIIKEKKQTFFNRDLGLNVSAQDKILITRHLHTMLAAGIGLDQALKTLAEQTPQERLRAVLVDLERRVQSGQPLNQALRLHPQYFSNLYVNLVQVGEKSGKLDQTLQYLLDQQENDYRLRTKVLNASIYPSIIIMALIGMVSLMLVFVIPRVESVLSSYNVGLPLQTRILLFMSRSLTHYYYYIIPAIIALILGARRLLRSVWGKRQWDRFLLVMPMFKGLVKEINQARITRTLTTTLKSGVPIDKALELTLSITDHTSYRLALERAIKLVRRGVSLGEILRGYPQLFPPITTRMIDVGEKSGQLDHMLERLAAFYETSVDTKLTNLSSIIEPLLILLVGLTAGFVAVSVMTPIWSFSKTI